MQIAHVSLLSDTVGPWPSSNAGRAVSYLIEELVSSGHEVTLFAGEQWETSAEFVRLRRIERQESAAQFRARIVRSALRGPQRFDIVHFHCDRPGLLAIGDVDARCVVTLHAPCEVSSRVASWGATLVPTSSRQLTTSTREDLRMPIPHGLPGGLPTLHSRPASYLAYNGPICQDGGVQSAVKVAERSGLELKVACEITPQDRGYFTEVFVPMLHASPRVSWVGEIDDLSRNALLGGALALLGPCDRSGAFEMQTIEALACGTPVIAWDDTAAADLIQDGTTGFVVRTTDEALTAVAKISSLDRHACRRAFDERFDIRVVARQYEQLYASTVHAYQAAAVTVESCRRVQAQADYVEAMTPWGLGTPT
jgi:glycosyl transferase family 1/glycosyl transferase family 4